jgi:uncharacterized protein
MGANAGKELVEASTSNNIEEVKRILSDANTDKSIVDHEDEFGKAALTAAAYYGHQEIVEMLLNDDRVYKRIIDHEGKYGDTALIMAALKGHRQIVEMLLGAGATLGYQTASEDPSFRQKYGFSPLSVEAMDLLSRRHYGKCCDCVIVAV